MNDFGETAYKLSRNPLGIIALFIALVYGVACLTFSFSNNIPASVLTYFVWFIIGYPVVVLITFVFLVIKHHTKLYAPMDFPHPEDFMKCAYGDQSRRISKREMIKEEANTPDLIAPPGIESEEKVGTPTVKAKKAEE